MELGIVDSCGNILDKEAYEEEHVKYRELTLDAQRNVRGKDYVVESKKENYLEVCITLSEGYDHVMMVERMLGMKRGTGGSDGVGYLRTTLSKKFFPELWEARTHLSVSPVGASAA